MTRKTSNTNSDLFKGLKAKENGKVRPLTEAEQADLIAILALNENPTALAVDGLIPHGSFLQRMCSFFKNTDASYALPLFQLIMLASSFLTQGGARLSVKGLGCLRPILWIIALASSGSSKTTATDKVSEILFPEGGEDPLKMLPTGSTDAQWIIDLAENNGAFWAQDEVGQLFKNVLSNPQYARIKPWMLDAYSNKPIANRLKGEAEKLTIDDPHFTFFGLSVRETWHASVDAASMLDGFCQRFNYVVAEPRTDTDMFDHFLFFAGEGVDQQKAGLHELWQALCAQEGALETYEMDADVLPFLEAWWSGLRANWGDGALPGSFVRRIGFSVLSYLVVLQFLLGKARRTIDIETAALATRFADFHLESTLAMMREYGSDARGHVCKVAHVRSALMEKGAPNVTVQDVQRKLSKKQNRELSKERIKQILDALDRLHFEPDLFENPLGAVGGELRQEKTDQLMERHAPIRADELRREKQRNAKRLARLLYAYRSQAISAAESVESEPHDMTDNVVSLSEDWLMPEKSGATGT